MPIIRSFAAAPAAPAQQAMPEPAYCAQFYPNAKSVGEAGILCHSLSRNSVADPSCARLRRSVAFNP